MLGGTCTLIGTSTNVAASGYVKTAGLAPFSMFEFLPVGVAVCVAGILYMTLVGHRLLPQTREAGVLEKRAIREYLSEVVVTPGSPLAGQALRDTQLAQMGLQVRADPARRPAAYAEPHVQLQEGDLLLVQASREGLLQVKDTAGIEIRPDSRWGRGPDERDADIAEALLMPQSRLIGRTIKELDFRRRFGLTVLAIYRHGHALATRIGGLPLRGGRRAAAPGPARAVPRAGGQRRPLDPRRRRSTSRTRRRKGLLGRGDLPGRRDRLLVRLDAAAHRLPAGGAGGDRHAADHHGGGLQPDRLAAADPDRRHDRVRHRHAEDRRGGVPGGPDRGTGSRRWGHGRP